MSTEQLETAPRVAPAPQSTPASTPESTPESTRAAAAARAVDVFVGTHRISRCLGINFFDGQIDLAVRHAKSGGLVCVPSAPVLVDMEEDPALKRAVQSADMSIADSGLMVLLHLLLKGKKIARISGLRFIQSLLADPEFRQSRRILWVMPSQKSADTNAAWLRKQGFHIGPENCYIAPMYPRGAIQDTVLLEQVEALKPDYIILGIGGGVQERLGHYLRDHSSGNATIVCTGGALAFVTGDQAPIPKVVDRLYLGWLSRCISQPRRFVPRYVRALKLVNIMVKRERSIAAVS